MKILTSAHAIVSPDVAHIALLNYGKEGIEVYRGRAIAANKK